MGKSLCEKPLNLTANPSALIPHGSGAKLPPPHPTHTDRRSIKPAAGTAVTLMGVMALPKLLQPHRPFAKLTFSQRAGFIPPKQQRQALPMDCSFLPAARAHSDRGSSALLLGTPHFLVTERRQEGWKGLYMGHTRAIHTEAFSPDSPLHPPIGSGNTQPTSKCSSQAQCSSVCKGKEKER